MFVCWLTYGYFNIVSNNSQQKNEQKTLFLATENAEIFLDRIDTVFFRHRSIRQAQDRLTRIHTDSSIVSNRGLERIYTKGIADLFLDEWGWGGLVGEAVAV